MDFSSTSTQFSPIKGHQDFSSIHYSGLIESPSAASSFIPAGTLMDRLAALEMVPGMHLVDTYDNLLALESEALFPEASLPLSPGGTPLQHKRGRGQLWENSEELFTPQTAVRRNLNLSPSLPPTPRKRARSDEDPARSPMNFRQPQFDFENPEVYDEDEEIWGEIPNNAFILDEEEEDDEQDRSEFPTSPSQPTSD